MSACSINPLIMQMVHWGEMEGGKDTINQIFLNHKQMLIFFYV